MSKILTIVVPSYNMEAYLGKCLDSLLVKDADGNVDGNLMQALEVLVINDGSKDRTSEIGHSYQDKYPGIFRVIDKENGHYGSCVNRGLAEATGAFIRVLDADDYEDNAKFKDFLELLLSFESDKRPEAVMTDYDYVLEDGKIEDVMHFDILPENKIFSFRNIDGIENYFFQNHNLTYRTDIPRSIDYRQTEGVLYSDSEWFIIPMTQVENVYYYPEVLVHYLMGREGQSVSVASMRRNFSMLLKVAGNIVSQLERLAKDSDKGGVGFAETRILQLIRNQYHHVAFDGFDDEQCVGLLKEFDINLKQGHPFYYNAIDSFSSVSWRKVKFSFVAEWRRRHSSCTLKFLAYKCLVFLGNIGHRIKCLLGKRK